MRSTIVSTLAFSTSVYATVLKYHSLPRDIGACPFTLTAHGPGSASGTIGQLSDGQNRIGGGYPTATFHYQQGSVVDSSKRGCILTPRTQQWQCDQGVPPHSGFSIGCDGSFLHNGSPTFHACPVNDHGEWNVYTTPVTGQKKCVAIKLKASGCETPCPAVPSPAVPKNYTHGAPNKVFVNNWKWVCNKDEYGRRINCHKEPFSPAPTYICDGKSPCNVTTPPTPAPSASSSPTPCHGKDDKRCTPTPTLCHDDDKKCTSTPTPCHNKDDEKCAPTPTPCHNKGDEKCTPTPTPCQNKDDENCTPATTPCQNKDNEKCTPATTPCHNKDDEKCTPTPTPCHEDDKKCTPTPTPSSAPCDDKDHGKANDKCHSTTCPVDLNGPYEFPHLIVPIHRYHRDFPMGNKLNGTIDQWTCTTYNFDIHPNHAGKTCSLIFLLPKHEDLETSAYEFKGEGYLHFNKLINPVTEKTTFNNKGAWTPVSTKTIEEDTSISAWSGSCEAGKKVGYEVCGEGIDLKYFQDFNPSPIGLYMRVC